MCCERWSYKNEDVLSDKNKIQTNCWKPSWTHQSLLHEESQLRRQHLPREIFFSLWGHCFGTQKPFQSCSAQGSWTCRPQSATHTLSHCGENHQVKPGVKRLASAPLQAAESSDSSRAAPANATEGLSSSLFSLAELKSGWYKHVAGLKKGEQEGDKTVDRRQSGKLPANWTINRTTVECVSWRRSYLLTLHQWRLDEQ